MTLSTTYRKDRAKKGTQEFFTPTLFVEEMIKNCPDEFFRNKKIFHESCCGNGNILELVYDRYREFHNHETALSCIYAFDLMQDNVIEAIKRLYGIGKIESLKGNDIPEDFRTVGLIAVYTHNKKLVKNLVCADGNIYKMNYGLESKPINFGNNLFEQLI